MIRTLAILTLLVLLAGCVDYDRAIERQLDKEHAAIAAQVEEAK